MEKVTILVVEDDINLLSIEERFLTHAGFSVLCAQDLTRAIQLTKDEAPSLLLLDVNLPNGSGLNLHERIRSIPALRDTAVIYVTGERSAPVLARASTMGAFMVMHKPLNLDLLLTNVKAALRKFNARKAAVAPFNRINAPV